MKMGVDVWRASTSPISLGVFPEARTLQEVLLPASVASPNCPQRSFLLKVGMAAQKLTLAVRPRGKQATVRTLPPHATNLTKS